MSLRLLTAASALAMSLSAAAAHAQDFRALAVQDLTKPRRRFARTIRP